MAVPNPRVHAPESRLPHGSSGVTDEKRREIAATERCRGDQIYHDNVARLQLPQEWVAESLMAPKPAAGDEPAFQK